MDEVEDVTRLPSWGVEMVGWVLEVDQEKGLLEGEARVR